MRNLFVPLVLLAASLAFSSCEDNEDPVWGNHKNSYRVVRATHYDAEGAQARREYSYQRDKLMSITTYEYDEVEGWLESEQENIAYMGDHITVSWSGFDEQNVLVSPERSSYIVRNGLMREETYEQEREGSWEPLYRWIYRYTGSYLTSWKSFSFTDGDTVQSSEAEYQYFLGRVSGEIVTYFDQQGEIDASEVLSWEYSGSILTGYTDAFRDENGDTLDAYRKQYSYVQGRIVSCTTEYLNETTEGWVAAGQTDYEYDENNNLIKVGNDSYWSEYEYEPGNGNARFFTYYPEEMIFGAPTLKSAVAPDEYIPYYKRVLPGVAQ